MKNLLFVMTLLFGVMAIAQTPAPSPAPAPNDYTIDISASYTSAMTAPAVAGTNANATRFTLRGPITGRFAWRLENLTLPKDQAATYLVGIEYDRFLSDLFHPKDAKFDASSFQVYAYGEAGGKKQDIATTPAISFLVGGGVRKHLTGNLWLNAIDIGYFRADFSHPGVILSSNNITTSAGIGLRF